MGGPHAPYRQSERGAHYEAALATLDARGLLFRCDCSRREIAGVGSAPHAGDEGPRYPGTCRPAGMRERPWKRAPAIRFAAPPGRVGIRDAWQGDYDQDVAEAVGRLATIIQAERWRTNRLTMKLPDLEVPD